MAIQLPVTNKELMDKYSPERFPVYAFGLDNEHTVTESIYGFPRTEDGVMKIGFRGVKVRDMRRRPCLAALTKSLTVDQFPRRQENQHSNHRFDRTSPDCASIYSSQGASTFRSNTLP